MFVAVWFSTVNPGDPSKTQAASIGNLCGLLAFCQVGPLPLNISQVWLLILCEFTLQLPLVVGLASKNNVISWITGISYERVSRWVLYLYLRSVELIFGLLSVELSSPSCRSCALNPFVGTRHLSRNDHWVRFSASTILVPLRTFSDLRYVLALRSLTGDNAIQNVNIKMGIMAFSKFLV